MPWIPEVNSVPDGELRLKVPGTRLRIGLGTSLESKMADGEDEKEEERNLPGIGNVGAFSQVMCALDQYYYFPNKI